MTMVDAVVRVTVRPREVRHFMMEGDGSRRWSLTFRQYEPRQTVQRIPKLGQGFPHLELGESLSWRACSNKE